MALRGSFPNTAEVHFACADRHHRSRFIRSVILASKYLKFSVISVTWLTGGKDYHIVVNDLINDKRMRLSAADPNYWLMLKIANSTYFLSSQSHFSLTLPR